jgi:polyhydroxybutyrate depolymerase
MLRCLFAAALLGLALCVPPVSAAADGAHTLTVAGVERSYLLHRPPQWHAGKRMPLVIALHGGGGSGAQMARDSGLDTTANAHGFLALYPNGSGRRRLLTWNAGDCCAYAQRENIDDVGFLLALIDHAIAVHGADPARIYVTGMSNGAMMAYRLAALQPGRIAAVGAVSGTMDATLVPRGAVPVMHVHGTADRLVPFAGGRGDRTVLIGVRNSVADTIAAWIRVNHADSRARSTPLPDLSDDGMHAIEHRHRAGADPRNVVLIEVVGGGHAWPGPVRIERKAGLATRDFDVNELLWNFFRAHSRPVAQARSR